MTDARKQDIDLGSNLNTTALVADGERILARGRADAAQLARFGLDAAFFDALARTGAEILTQSRAREIARLDVGLEVDGLGDLFANAKDWLADLAVSADMLADAEGETAETLSLIVPRRAFGNSRARLREVMAKVVPTAEALAERLSRYGMGAAQLAEGKRLLAELTTNTAERTLKESELPRATADFYALKAAYFRMLKRVEKAASSAFRNHGEARAAYDLKALKALRKAPKPAPKADPKPPA